MFECICLYNTEIGRASKHWRLTRQVQKKPVENKKKIIMKGVLLFLLHRFKATVCNNFLVIFA